MRGDTAPSFGRMYEDEINIGGQDIAPGQSIRADYSALAVLRIVVSSFAQGFERRQIDQRLEQMAFEDPLTGLPNRALLGRRLEEALAKARLSGRLLAVGYLDLDAFKRVNDRYGHAVGDELLAVMATRLRQSMHPGETVARLGGDEFVVVLPEMESQQRLLERAEALLGVVAEPCTMSDGYCVAMGTSLGLRLVPPDDADPDLLLRQADQAMYAAKRFGGNHFCFHESCMKVDFVWPLSNETPFHEPNMAHGGSMRVS